MTGPALFWPRSTATLDNVLRCNYSAVMTEPERWKRCRDYRGYSVSSHGRVRLGERILPQSIPRPRQNYPVVSVHLSGRSRTVQVHRLMRTAFFPPSKVKTQINHKDGNKANNDISNLELRTPKENIRHSVVMGLKKCRLNSEAVKVLRFFYKRIEIGLLSRLHKTGVSTCRQAIYGNTWNAVKPRGIYR